MPFIPNQIIRHNRLVFIKLTQGKWTIINEIDYDKVKQFKWHTSVPKGGKTYYARTIPPGAGKRRISIKLHQILRPCARYFEVDHKNRNGLDNRISNLRVVTHAENMLNKSLRLDNPTGHTGISWDKLHNRWHAGLCLQGQAKHLGFFTCFKKALASRKAAEIKYFGSVSKN